MRVQSFQRFAPLYKEESCMKTLRRITTAMGLVCALGGAAAQAQGIPTLSREVFSDADLNRDGGVSLDEFHKDIVRSFHALDFDRDGYITAGELGSLPDRETVRRMERMIRRADQDGDGRLSFREVVEVRMRSFDEADTDRNDRISLDEALAFDKRLEALRTERRESRAAQRGQPAAIKP
jgi:hypothetical protein